MKRAIFPDQKSLQPIPTTNGVHANISGNTNSTTGIQFTPNNQFTSTDTNNIVNNAPANQITTQKNYLFYTIGILIVLAITFVLIYIAKNRIQR